VIDTDSRSTGHFDLSQSSISVNPNFNASFSGISTSAEPVPAERSFSKSSGFPKSSQHVPKASFQAQPSQTSSNSQLENIYEEIENLQKKIKTRLKT
jgi:uncharacterized FlaG/YvyC family protein